MESLLNGIPGVIVYIDDILVTGTTTEEHLKALDEVLSRLEKAGLCLQKQKCSFMQTSVTYLGHSIEADGIRPVPEKVEAVRQAPQPQNAVELRSYLGLLTYYSKFLPNMSTVLAPLYRLLRRSTSWRWGYAEHQAFEKSKQLLTSAPLLVHYDPELELILACDASAHGIGAVLSHRMPDGSEKPIGFVSHTLSKTEIKYPQIEKEGLSCVFGVKKFLYGRPFTLVTDHKPLFTLFNESRALPPQASGRIQHWALTLAAYEYTLSWPPTKQHENADAMSCLPLPEKPLETPLPAELVLLMEHLEESQVTATQIRMWARRDSLLSRVSCYLCKG